MKKTYNLWMFAVVLALSSSSVFAQTCASPTTLTSGGSFSGNSCTADGTIGGACGGALFTGNAAVFTWTYNGTSPRSGSITVTPTISYDVALAVVRGSCTGTATCVQLVDATQDGTSAEAFALSGAGTAATYYLFVTSLGDGSAGATCGTFSGTVGTLPVELKSFSID